MVLISKLVSSIHVMEQMGQPLEIAMLIGLYFLYGLRFVLDYSIVRVEYIIEACLE